MIISLFFAVAAVAGDWTGTSLCTDLKALPACHDEVVVYHMKEIDEHKVHVAADKIVDGKPAFMGEFDLVREGARLTSEGVDRQGRRAVWEFHVDGDHMTGTLTMKPGGEVARKIDVKRKK